MSYLDFYKNTIILHRVTFCVSILKTLFKQYKPVIVFMVTFLGVYIVLSFVYSTYLDKSSIWSYYPDFFTSITGEASRWLMEFFGYKVTLYKDTKPFLRVLIEEVYAARIVEGCNAISVIILFLAFIIAFASNLKATVIYACSGTLLIFVANIVRVAVFVIAIYHYPQYTEILHSVVFPSIIYGLVFLLWVVWVYKFYGVSLV